MSFESLVSELGELKLVWFPKVCAVCWILYFCVVFEKCGLGISKRHERLVGELEQKGELWRPNMGNKHFTNLGRHEN